MKKYFFTLLLLLAVVPAARAQAQKGSSYVIGFYNLENLFDTYHDEGKNDYQYLPDGDNAWTEVKYAKKLHNMAHVIAEMAKENGRYHTVLGVSEVENRHALEDLVAEPEIADANFQIIHYDGPDRRGVDCALLYRPELMQVVSSESIPFDFNSEKIKFEMDKEAQDNFRTRDILMVHGIIDGEHFAFYVCHLPSRIGGKGQDLRARGGEIAYEHARKMEAEFPGIKIVVMGDMNDNPTDESMAVYLRGKEDIKEVGEEDFFSPFLSMFKAGYGTLAYRGEWNIYDCILVNYNLAHAQKGTLRIQPLIKKKKAQYYGRVFQKPFMTNQTGQYAGTPFRTFSGGQFIGGYSDHYPTYIVVSKK
ncbi:MAG: endonuclease/exonuclease/phosphatase family protein [Bacteroidales bacterium]|nr:endonuclease/exonuclease/phosphatase family protein [Bacteroidales bacterium]